MKINYKKGIASVFILFLGNLLNAQVQNNGSIYIGDSGVVYLATGNYNFGVAPATTSTSRTSSVYGKLGFASGSTWSNATANHYVDGYVKIFGTSPFVIPVGQSGVYAPVKVVASNSNGIDAAYYRNSPNAVGTNVNPNISSLSSLEYWDIRGVSVNASISLSWRASSNLAALTSSVLTNITIAGWNGTSWVIIPSTIDTTSIFGNASSLTEGSITTDSTVNLATYTYFTLASKEISCSPLIVSSGNVKTWNGSWSPSEPTLEDPVVINAPYSGNLACNSLTLNSDITLSNGQVVEIINEASGTGKIIMSSEASVVQRNPTSLAPKIQMTKVTNPMRRYDYIFLSSPIDNINTYFSDLANANNVAVNGNFGSQAMSAFESYRTFDAAGLVATNATPANTPIARGFSASVRNLPPYVLTNNAGDWFTEKYPIHIKTSGVANNGNVSVTVPSNGWARIGNPYPSSIDGFELLDALGTNVRKTLYYWTFNTPRQIIANPGNYNNADFATWNYSGGVAVCPTCQVPTGTIATMQSVLVKASNATPTTFNVTNCMRETTGNNNFFRANSTIDRYWLNLSGSNESFSQTLIAYSGNGTLDYDDGFDSQKMGGVLSSQLTTLIGNSKMAIQTRPEFTETDQVPLQIDQVNGETLTISLGNKEGVFADSSVSIYLYDSLLNQYHNLALGNYTYTPTVANDGERFKIVYQSSSLNDPDFAVINAFASINNQVLSVKATKEINHVVVYDITGKLISTYNAEATTDFTSPFVYAHGIYLAKITLVSGEVITQKLINSKY